jgi:hypothetical protein
VRPQIAGALVTPVAPVQLVEIVRVGADELAAAERQHCSDGEPSRDARESTRRLHAQ